jgi:hypothetical protein
MTVHRQGYPGSGNIRELSYDDETLTLYAEFRHGGIYAYEPVQIDVWNTLHATTTGIGTIFSALIVKQAGQEKTAHEKRYTYRKEAAHPDGGRADEGTANNPDGGGDYDGGGAGAGSDADPSPRWFGRGPPVRADRPARPPLGTRRPPKPRAGGG